MKKYMLFTLAFVFSAISYSQSKSEAYMGLIPSLPAKECDISRAESDEFINKVNALIHQLDKDLDKLKEEEDQQAEKNASAGQDQAAKMLQEYGLSEADIAKMKNSKNMTQEEKMAMANKMMTQQPSVKPTQGSGAKSTPAESSKGTYQLMTEQQEIMSRLNAGAEKTGALYQEIDNDPAGKKMLANINKWQSQLGAMGGVDYGQGKQMDSLALLIRNEKEKYCAKYTPKYRIALSQHLQTLKASMPDLQRQAEVSDAITKAQAGISNPPQAAEISKLGAISGYLRKLVAAYQYKLYYED